MARTNSAYGPVPLGMPTADFWNQRMTPGNLFGLNPGAPSRAAGHALPPTSVTGGDRAFVPWSPDSPVFWLLVITGATVLGITGASVKVRAFKGRASANLGST